jgi:hypothetical protein
MSFYGPFSFHLCVDFSTIHFRRCLILGRASEYNHVAKAFQPMMVAIPSEDNIDALHSLHPPPLDLDPPLMFDY